MFRPVTVTIVPTYLDAWATNSDGSARTSNPWPTGGAYVEPALYVPSEEVFIKGWLEGEGKRLSNMSVNLWVDGVWRNIWKTDGNGDFFMTVGKLSVGSHILELAFFEYGGYGESRDTVYVEVKTLDTFLDVWTEGEGNIAKTSFRAIEDVYFNGVLTAQSPANGGKRLSKMSIEISIDGGYIKTVLTDAYGMFDENLGALGMGTHAIKGKFYPWEDYEGSEDVENPVTVGPRRLLENFPRLDKFIRDRRVWQRYAELRGWGESQIHKF